MELRWSTADLQGMVLRQIMAIQACVSRYLLKADHRTISCYDDAGCVSMSRAYSGLSDFYGDNARSCCLWNSLARCSGVSD